MEELNFVIFSHEKISLGIQSVGRRKRMESQAIK